MPTQEAQPVIIAARRTPVGRFLGGLAGVSATQMGAWAIEAAVKDAGVDSENIDECVMGCVLQAGLGQNPARRRCVRGLTSGVVRVRGLGRVGLCGPTDVRG